MIPTRRVGPAAAMMFLVLTAAAGCTSDDAASAAASSQVSTSTASTAPSTDQATPSDAGDPSTPSEPVFAGQIVEVSIAGGQVQTAQPRIVVALNTAVRLIVTSDVADEVHVHGIDEEFGVAPGVTVTHDFIADIPGIFEVEVHGDAGLLFTLQVEP